MIQIDIFLSEGQIAQEKGCPHCGQSSQTVFVHDHEQCMFCKNNV